MKIWRRLQAIGAVPIKNAVYALPASEKALVEFGKVLREIFEGGGDALVCRAALVDGLSDIDMRALFDAARDLDYDELASDARTLLAREGADCRRVHDSRRQWSNCPWIGRVRRSLFVLPQEPVRRASRS